MIKTEKVHIITFSGREFDRTTTPWEKVKMFKDNIAKVLNGSLTFDFR